MTRKFVLAGGLACSLAAGGCVKLPELAEATGGIPVYEIVLRTKCELSSAFEDDDGIWLPDRYKKLAWLQNWTAQADLTLQVLDQATLAPGTTFTQPLHNAYPTNVGPSSISTAGVLGTTISGVSQSFAVAAGVSLNGQAQRTETLSFVFSVKELKEWRASTDTREICAISDKLDLRGRLGLREWFRDAVWPVVSPDELLYAGYHPKAANAASKPQGNGETKSFTAEMEKRFIKRKEACTPDNIAVLKSDLDAAQDTLDTASEIAKDAKGSFATVSSKVDSETQALAKAKKSIAADKKQYDAVLDPAVKKDEDKNWANVNAAQKLADAAAGNIADAKAKLDQLTLLPDKDITKAKDSVRQTRLAIEKAEKDLNTCDYATLHNDVIKAQATAANVLSDANAATKDVASANQNITDMKTFVDAATEFTSKAIDPPIATIGQSVQFILVYSGNVTPSWTFVRFKGPNSPLFSAGGTRTHTLNITLGPVNPTTNAPNNDVKQNQFYLQLNSVLSPQLQ